MTTFDILCNVNFHEASNNAQQRSFRVPGEWSHLVEQNCCDKTVKQQHEGTQPTIPHYWRDEEEANDETTLPHSDRAWYCTLDSLTMPPLLHTTRPVVHRLPVRLSKLSSMTPYSYFLD